MRLFGNRKKAKNTFATEVAEELEDIQAASEEAAAQGETAAEGDGTQSNQGEGEAEAANVRPDDHLFVDPVVTGDEHHRTAWGTAGFPCVVAAIDVGGTKIAGALVRYNSPNEAPTVQASRTVASKAKEGGTAVLDRVIAMATDLINDATSLGIDVSGIGVSTAGRVEAGTGNIAYANEIMPGWAGQPVGDSLRNTTGLPVSVINDVQAHALGEVRWGVAQGTQTCLVIAAGTGLGGAVIADGKLLRGKHGFAGEIGHIASNHAHGIPCTCGGTGHLELVASGSGIEARYAEAVEKLAATPGSASEGDQEETPAAKAKTGAEISALAQEGDLIARKVIMRAGIALGEAIADLTNVLDPEMVVVSGSVTKAGGLWRTAVQEGFERQIPDAQKDLPIEQAQLGETAPLVGAAEELLSNLFAEPSFQ